MWRRYCTYKAMDLIRSTKLTQFYFYCVCYSIMYTFADLQIDRKQRLLTHMELYKQSLVDRQQIVQHISDWLDSCDDLEKGCISEEEWEKREERFRGNSKRRNNSSVMRNSVQR